MSNPQSKAIMIGKNSCLAMCYIYCIDGKEKSDGTILKMISDAMDQGILDEECFVMSAAYLMEFFSGKKYFVDKQSITSIDKIKDPTPVFYSIDGKTGHWVVVANGKIVYNPLIISKNVNLGKPISARLITRL